MSDILNSLAKMNVPLFPKKAQYGQGNIPDQNELAKMTFADLYSLRKKLKTTEEQNAVAPYEHQAFTRGFVADPLDAEVAGVNVGDLPSLRAASMMATTVPYTYMKSLGLDKSIFGGKFDIGGEGRSDPSFEEAARGLIGVGQGAYDVQMRRLNKLREMLGI